MERRAGNGAVVGASTQSLVAIFVQAKAEMTAVEQFPGTGAWRRPRRGRPHSAPEALKIWGPKNGKKCSGGPGRCLSLGHWRTLPQHRFFLLLHKARSSSPREGEKPVNGNLRLARPLPKLQQRTKANCNCPRSSVLFHFFSRIPRTPLPLEE